MMKKTYLYVITFTVIIGILVAGSANANPIPGDPGPGATLLPLEKNTTVYLWRETIDVYFNDDRAKVHCRYWLRNDGGDTELSIRLPFTEKPSELKLYIRGSLSSFEWTEFTFNKRANITWWNHFEAIGFNITFKSGEMVKVDAVYKRGIRKITPGLYDEIIYAYEYLVGSARAWNHPIDYARFRFFVPEEMFDGLFYNQNTSQFSLKENGGFKVGTFIFRNWTPYYDYIDFWWIRDPPLIYQIKDPLICVIPGAIITGILISVAINKIMIVRKRRKGLRG